MEQLLSGLYGALIATILSIVYLYFSEQIKLRSEVMLEVVGYSDDIYNNLSLMHVHKDSMYTQEKPGLTNEEYRKYSNDLSVLLKSTKIRAKIALVYGEGAVLGIFNQLWQSYIEVSSVLRTATRSAWEVKENKEIHNIFTNEIDPNREQLEKLLLKSASVKGVSKSLVERSFPTFISMFRFF